MTVETPFDARDARGFAFSSGRGGGLVDALSSEARAWLESNLRALSADDGIAHLGLLDGRLVLAIHGVTISVSRRREMARVILRARTLLATALDRPTDYRGSPTRETVPDAAELAVNALAARAFVTDRERDSLFWAFENERLAWLAEDENEKILEGSETFRGVSGSAPHPH